MSVVPFLLIIAGASPKPFSLVYHDVLEKKAVWFDCTPREFREQIEALQAKKVNFVTLAQVEAAFRGQPLPPRAVVLTFADNYRGFLTYAYPVLRAKRIPCAMFVHTGFVGSNVGRPKMTWDELRKLDREGLVTLASQTVTHRDLDHLSSDEQRRELKDSKLALERQLGHSVRFLAYPNGAFSQETERLAAEAGYALAFAEVQRPIDVKFSRFQISRYVHTKWKTALRQAGYR